MYPPWRVKRNLISETPTCLSGLVSLHPLTAATLKYYRRHIMRSIVHSGSQCYNVLLSVTGQVRVHKPHVRLAAHVPRECPQPSA